MANKTLINIFFLCTSLSAFAQTGSTPDNRAILTTKAKINQMFNPRQSHWVAGFNVEGLEYELPFKFEGNKKFGNERRSLNGGRLGLGREFYLGRGFMTTTKAETYFLDSFSVVENSDTKENTAKSTFTKNPGQIYGLDAVQSFSYLFDIKTKNLLFETWSYLTLEPFIEVGIGAARAFNKKLYRDTSSFAGPENYTENFSDELTNSKIGIGVNFTSPEGFFSYIRVTQNRYDITKRRARGEYAGPNGSGNLDRTISNPRLDPVVIYAIGGGYKF